VGEGRIASVKVSIPVMEFPLSGAKRNP